jgi:arsenate reductase
MLRRIAGDRFDVYSAGTIASFVRPQAIRAMEEIGIDIGSRRSKSVDEFAGQSFDYVITVCDNAKQNCPIFPGKTERIHWSFDDPAEATGSEDDVMSVFRRVRDEIRQRLRDFAAANR